LAVCAALSTVQDCLQRFAAKAAAAREGVILTRFIHSALEMRLNAVTRRNTALASI
jgi:hypothetical protein